MALTLVIKLTAMASFQFFNAIGQKRELKYLEFT
ncbi:hypothetical protein F1K70_04860 [Vibrio parahaemolyticus]|nr:hypothetical protein [Vibrio parahaemolyticus]EGQ8249120.1 hypothetical protein [Vibrio parahaemolyticus]EGQ8452316.1 hypothetical protein [Vibrio parahaemolyticus]EGQ8929544.1 hypothetical protein [Vibrio parahaemolyticus]EGQ8973760.1 hypothetical protein [Vibrio parahaemolyticus]